MLKPKIQRRVKPHQDFLLRDGAWTVMLPTMSGRQRYVAQYCPTFAAAMSAVDAYHLYRPDLRVPEVPDAVEIVASRGIGIRVIP